MSKTHYRNVAKSDHLSSADLEDMQEQGKRLVFTIREVRQEKQARVAGKKIDANIAYFKEDIKPLVLNMTNSKQVREFAPNKSPFVEDWANITIELYIDHNVKMKGETVDGVRVSPNRPVVTLPTLTTDHKRFESAKKAWKEGKQEGVKKQFTITEEIEKLLNE